MNLYLYKYVLMHHPYTLYLFEERVKDVSTAKLPWSYFALRKLQNYNHVNHVIHHYFIVVALVKLQTKTTFTHIYNTIYWDIVFC